MAKFDISPRNVRNGRRCGARSSRQTRTRQAIASPPRPSAVYGLILSGCAQRCSALGPIRPGDPLPSARLAVIFACFLAVIDPRLADPTTRADSHGSASAARERASVVPPATFAPSWDLDGTYLWLGPTRRGEPGRRRSGTRRSAADAAVRPRPRGRAARRDRRRRSARAGGPSAAAAGSGSMPSLGTRPAAGWSASRPGRSSSSPSSRIRGSAARSASGASSGVTPFARVGAVDDLGGFAEIGIHIALPGLAADGVDIDSRRRQAT